MAGSSDLRTACLRDGYNRPINYLRISVTDRCNFRCVYCMPSSGVTSLSHEDVLSYEEITLVARAAAELGISKIRLTGGEPLVRAGIVDLVRTIASIPGIDDLALTTNGVLLGRYAAALKEAGLKRVNVSLDTLRPERFQAMTRVGKLDEVLEGIGVAERVGLKPIKINMVVMRGVNDDEVADMAARTHAHDWNVRFIELMPMGQSDDWAQRYVSVAEMKDKLAALGDLRSEGTSFGETDDEQDSPENAGPARYYRLDGAIGTLGFISPVSEHFCHRCNRLRLTADGRLRPCLLSDREVDLRSVLREGAGLEDVKRVIAQATLEKPWTHHLDEGLAPRGRTMSEIGG